ncbi:MAG: PepSY domain-containing protein [Pontibacterium sp.]
MKKYMRPVILSGLMVLGFSSVHSALPESQPMALTLNTANVMRLDTDACRVLVEAGTILSMMELMDLVKALTDGRMLDTSLLKQGDNYIYEMDVAGKDGVVRRLLVDARTGQMIEEGSSL